MAQDGLLVTEKGNGKVTVSNGKWPKMVKMAENRPFWPKIDFLGSRAKISREHDRKKVLHGPLELAQFEFLHSRAHPDSSRLTQTHSAAVDLEIFAKQQNFRNFPPHPTQSDLGPI